MAHFDLVKAVVATMRAVPALNGGVGGRFYGGRVPPDAPFPRCYTHIRDGAARRRAGMGDFGQDFFGVLDVIFACTTVETKDPESFLESMDTAAEAVLHYAALDPAQVPGFVYIRRVMEIPIYDQEEYRLTFYVVGGAYEFLRQTDS